MENKALGERHQELISTQQTLRQRFEENPSLAHGYYVLAGTQLQGRGRADRLWKSVEGNLHVSILLRKFPFKLLTWVPLWIATALHRTLADFQVDENILQLKWPNDLLLHQEKKVAGILCEKKGDEIFAGIGLNLLHAPLPEAGVVPFPKVPNPEAVIQQLLNHLSWIKSVDEIRDYYEKHSLFQNGSLVTWTEKGMEHQGTMVGLGEYGELRVNTGEVVLPLFSEDVSLAIPPAKTNQSTSPSE
jgi:BirA family biotin operon repressor/biotin-[acetyl-CoA-carboxylase] ligase